jgi:hypothetical protein
MVIGVVTEAGASTLVSGPVHDTTNIEKAVSNKNFMLKIKIIPFQISHFI